MQLTCAPPPPSGCLGDTRDHAVQHSLLGVAHRGRGGPASHGLRARPPVTRRARRGWSEPISGTTEAGQPAPHADLPVPGFESR